MIDSNLQNLLVKDANDLNWVQLLMHTVVPSVVDVPLIVLQMKLVLVSPRKILMDKEIELLKYQKIKERD